MGELWPCEPWVDDEFMATWCTGWGTATEQKREAAVALAGSILYVKTGRAYGICSHAWRPCTPCGCAGWAGCGCSTYPSLELERGPAVAITSVKANGVTLDPAAYTLTEQLPWRPPVLLRTDGQPWPCCQDLAAGPDEHGSWEVIYTWGNPLPPGAEAMTATLACEYLGLWAGGACRLPKRLTTLSREGMTATFLDTLESLATGLLGIPEVDHWWQTINPGGADRQPKVLNVDDMGLGVDPTDIRAGVSISPGQRPGPGLQGPWPGAISWPSV